MIQYKKEITTFVHLNLIHNLGYNIYCMIFIFQFSPYNILVLKLSLKITLFHNPSVIASCDR